MIKQLHHVAILTSNIEEAIQYYCKLLGCQARDPVEVDKGGARLRTVMLPLGPSGTTFLQLIEPEQGPGVEELKRTGEGVIFEIGFQTEDIESFHSHLATMGIEASDLCENPIQKKYLESKYGNRYFVLPRSMARGSRLEIVQICKP